MIECTIAKIPRKHTQTGDVLTMRGPESPNVDIALFTTFDLNLMNIGAGLKAIDGVEQARVQRYSAYLQVAEMFLATEVISNLVAYLEQNACLDSEQINILRER